MTLFPLIKKHLAHVSEVQEKFVQCFEASVFVVDVGSALYDYD